jgi:hypothetical protein
MLDEDKFMNKLRTKDEKLSKQMYEKILDPMAVLDILVEKLQICRQIESSLNDPRNKLILDGMKAGIENKMMIIQIKRDMDEQFSKLNDRIDQLQFKISKLSQ